MSLSDDEGSDDEMGKSFLKPLGDMHLRSALKIPPLDDILSMRNLRPNERRAALKAKSIFDNRRLTVGEPASWIGGFFLTLSYIDVLIPDSVISFVNFCQDETNSLCELEVNSYKKLYCDDGKKALQIALSKDTKSWKSNYAGVKLMLMAAVQYSVSCDSDREVSQLLAFFPGVIKGQPVLSFGDYHIILLGELVGLIKTGDVFVNRATKEVYLNPEAHVSIQYLDCLRMIADKVAERDNVLSAVSLGHPCFPELYPSREVILYVLELFDIGLAEWGNDFYKAVKMYEAVLVGVTLKLKNTGFVPEELDYLQNTIDDAPSNYQQYLKRLATHLIENKVPYHHLCQLHGLFRMWGHPVIDAIAGVKKMRDIGKKKKSIHPRFPKLLDRKFKETFFLSYYQKNRESYPPHELPSGEWSYLFNCLQTGEKFNKKDPDYQLIDWDKVTLKPTYQLPETFNLSLLVADTAISPTREELKSVENNPKGALKPEWRRGVIKWIKDGVIDCMLLLIMINFCPTGLPLIWLIIGLYPKEREVNPVARMFSLMTLMMRAYFVVTEDMLSKHILSHFPNISMTFDLLSLTKRLSRMTRDQQHQGRASRTFCINIDFEKWNLNFRKEVTYPLFKSLGCLFGLENLYNRTYDIFRNSLLYLTDGSYMPKFDNNYNWLGNDPDNAFEGHLGGNEGLRQKGWTLATSLLLDVTCEDQKVSYNLMGQGDNQVLNVTIFSELASALPENHPRVKEEIKGKLRTFLNDLYRNSRMIGLPIKPLETWVSDTFFAYGKLPVFEGVAGCQSLKKLARCFPFSNEDIMTLDNALGSITATFNAACNADAESLIPLWIAKYNQVLAIHWFRRMHPLGAQRISLDEEPELLRRKVRRISQPKDSISARGLETNNITENTILRAISLIPKSLGGFNTLSLLGSSFRGVPDPLTHSLVQIKEIYNELLSNKANYPEMSGLRLVLGTWLDPLFVKDPNFSLLFSDPYSICLIQPLGTKSITQKMVREQVRKISGNSVFAQWFKQLLSITEDSLEKELIDYLAKPDSLFPRLNYSLMKDSIYGYAESVVSKVDKTVTLSRMTSGNKDVIGTVWRGELQMWYYFAWRCRVRGRKYTQSCTTRYAQALREFCWNKEILGVTCPCSYEVIAPVKDKGRKQTNRIRVRTEISSLLRRHQLETFNGKHIPYLGSRVLEAQQFNATKMAYGADPLLARPVNLLRAINWIIPQTSNWAKLILMNLSSVTDFDPMTFIESDPLFLDNADQKFSEGLGERGAMWNHLFSLGSHVTMSTLEWEDAGEKGDVILQFQSLLCMIQSSFLDQLRSATPTIEVSWVTDCKECLRPPINQIMDLPAVPKKLFPSIRGNPYLFINKDKVFVEVNKKLKELHKIKRVTTSIFIVPEKTCANLITEVYAKEFIRRLNQEGQDNNLDLSVLSSSSDELTRINMLLYFQLIAMGMWRTVFSATESRGRIPNWSLDKELIIKRLLRKEDSCFQAGLFWFMCPETLAQLREISGFCPPLSYPVSIQHGLRSVKNTIILFVQKMKGPPYVHYSNYLHQKSQDSVRTLSLSTFSRFVNKADFCRFCMWSMATFERKSVDTLEDLKQEKCFLSHNIFPESLTSKVLILETPWRQIIKTAEKAIPPSTRRALRNKISSLTDLLQELRGTMIVQGINHKQGSKFIGQVDYEVPLIKEKEDNLPYLLSPLSLPTRGYCRIYELIASLPSLWGIRKTITVLGDGFGGSSIAVEELFPGCGVNCWTLLDSSDALPRSFQISIPPSHYIEYSNIKDLSSTWYGDVFSDEFQGAWEIEPSLINTSVIISEVELAHYPDETSDKDTIEMVRRLLTLKKEIYLIKLKMKDYKVIHDLIEISVQVYYTWKLISTPLVNIRNGECWLILKRTTKRINREAGEENNNRIVNRWLALLNSDKEMNDVGVSYHLVWDNIICASKNQQMMMNEQETSGWFFSVGITKWQVTNFTGLFNQIRTFKVPERILDQGGSIARYWFRDDAEALKLRLLVLALVRLEDVSFVNKLLRTRMSCRVSWTRKRKGKISYPLLRFSGDPLTDTEVSIIVKYYSVVKYFYTKVNGMTFRTFGKECPFKYINPHVMRQERQVFFAVSKTLNSNI
nr:TPA_asm: L [Sesamum betacytorhabdovirus 1_Ses]